VRLYAWGPSPDEPLIWYETTGGPVRRFLHADHQGSVIAVTDVSLVESRFPKDARPDMARGPI
jgi:hypothetical protein